MRSTPALRVRSYPGEPACFPLGRPDSFHWASGRPVFVLSFSYLPSCVITLSLCPGPRCRLSSQRRRYASRDLQFFVRAQNFKMSPIRLAAFSVLAASLI